MAMLMYGFRAKIGLVIPSNNTVIEPELSAMCPRGVTIHGNRILTYGNTPEGIAEMEKGAERAVSEFSRAGMSVIAYACLATSLVKGAEWSKASAQRIASAAACKALTAALATIDAAKALGASTVAVASPYTQRVQVHVRPFLESFGLRVVEARSLDVEDSHSLWLTPRETVEALALSVDTPEAEAIMILSTDLPSAVAIDALEQRAGKPVITTNQAIAWKALQLSGIPDPVEGFGTLLSMAR
jgi:arylmalonate decarboxylase